MADTQFSKIKKSDGSYAIVADATARTHIASSIMSNTGLHGVRYYNGAFQVYDDTNSEWVTIASSDILEPKGTVTFAELPANPESGWMYNVSNEFTTDNRFREGSGVVVPAGSNVYYTSDGKWDVLAGSPVTGIKGANEQNYRKGNVSLSAADVGAIPEITGVQGQMIGFDANGDPIATAVPSSGHEVIDKDGTTMTKRSKLRFLKSTITDDATNDVTVVTPDDEIIVLTQAEYDALPDSKLSDGKTYFVSDSASNDDYTSILNQLAQKANGPGITFNVVNGVLTVFYDDGEEG